MTQGFLAFETAVVVFTVLSPSSSDEELAAARKIIEQLQYLGQR